MIKLKILSQNPIRALAVELGPHKDRGKLFPDLGWDLCISPLELMTVALPTEPQDQTGAGCGC